MTKESRRQSDKTRLPKPNAWQQQPYDNLLKRLVEGQYATIIPLLLRDSTITRIEELNVEMLLPPRRGDRVYRIFYQGEWHILHIEFESSPDDRMDSRLHVYHSLLWHKYRIPIISVIVYPFEVITVSSPMIERNARKEIDVFHFDIVRLWLWDAREWINNKEAIPLYGLLPTMSELTDELLLQAINDMVQFYSGNETLLRDELLCFRVMLQRAKRLPEPELGNVLRRISMFDKLLEEDPWVQELQAKSLEKGIEKGIAKGQKAEEVKSARDFLIDAVRLRFPALTSLAEIRAVQMEKPEPLKRLFEQIVLAADEDAARVILETYPNA